MGAEQTEAKVLFFSANAGTGHNNAATALANAAREIDGSIQTKIVNSYDFLNQPLGKVMEEGYLQLLRLLPTLYGYFYDRNSKKKSLSNIKNWLTRISASNFKLLIDQEKPDLIVCTHAFPCGIIAELKQKHSLETKVIGVVTDFVVSPFWLYPETDIYLIASEDLKVDFKKSGISDDKVKITGIPIDPRFNGAGISKQEAREKLGLQLDQPVLLIMGGGLGMNPAANSLRILKKINTPLQAVVVMGKNEREKKAFQDSIEQFQNSRVKVRVLGYVDNIFEYMKAADLLVTKPGGVTTAEAISAGLPMIVTAPIPGQETRNIHYIIERGMAVPVFREKDLHGAIEELILNPSALEEISRRAMKFSIPDSARRGAEHLISCLN
jgi:processive 1,2-diacylglycerol beta-glucosyltransferase